MRAIILLVLSISIQTHANVKLYSINCGMIRSDNFQDFSDEGYFDGKKVEVVAPCFLISHPKGNFLWDTGVGKNQNFNKIHLNLITNPILPELKKISLTARDIDFLAFSHLHIDHIGQADTFKESVWIMNQDGWKNMKNHLGEKSFMKYYTKAKKRLIKGDYDVFGDGLVKIISVPGHTLGHQALLIKLKKSGVILLSGDVYHQRESRSEKLIPSFNVDRADSLASIKRVEGIIKHQKAKLVIQHDIRDFKLLPKFPKYLE